MKILKLGDICEISTGSTDTKDATENGQYPLFDRSKKVKGSDKYLFDCEAIIMPGEGAEFLPRHYIGKFDLHQRAYAMYNFSDLINPQFLYYFLISVKDYFADNAVGATVKSLRRRHFTELDVPLPSLEKQRDTVKKLDSAFTEIDLLEDNLVLSEEKANELLHSLLSHSFAYPAVCIEPAITSPKQSVTVKLVTLKDVVSFEKKQGSFDLAYVGLEDIESNTGSHLGSLEPRKVKSNTFAFTSDHLLYGRLRPYLNKVLLPNFDGHCSTEIFPIKVSKDILREYLFYWFRLQSTVEAINETSTGARMPRANMDAVLEFEIPLPPIAKQREIVDKLDSVFDEIEALRAQINMEKGYAVALRQSLLSRAFTLEEAVA